MRKTVRTTQTHTYAHFEMSITIVQYGEREGSDGAYRKDTAIKCFMGVFTTKERKFIPIQKNSHAF